MMVLGVQMRVKNTFLEVDEAATAGGTLRRCETAPAALTAWSNSGVEAQDSDAESDCSGRGVSSTASTTSSARSAPAKPPVRGGAKGAGPQGADAPHSHGEQPLTGGPAASLEAPVRSRVRGVGRPADGATPAGANAGGAVAAYPNQRGGARAARGRRQWGAAEEVSGAERALDRATHNGAAPLAAGGSLTTVMLKNLPNDYTRPMLLQLLDEQGFAFRYDFAYLPTDFKRRAGLGYAFVNMASAADAAEIRTVLEGFSKWILPTAKVCSVGWSMDQGLEANAERYRNSPVMHPSVPDSFKPIILRDGMRVPFPEPTKKLRRPNTTARKSGR